MSDETTDRLKKLYASRTLIWILIFLGAALRISRYLHNPPLYFDEADTAIDIITRPFSDLIHPSPDFDQTYPFSFLMLNKILISMLGNSEYVFRLLPLFSGIISIMLFLYVARSCISPDAVPAALFFFAILDPLVHYSSINKPYSGDLAWALMIFALTVRIQSKTFNWQRSVLFASAGAIAVWFSSPSVFMLAGIGTSLTVSCLSDRQWTKLRSLSIVFLSWSASFIIMYFFYIRKAVSNITVGVEEILKQEDALMPVPPTSISDILWFINTFFRTFNFHDFFDFGVKTYNLTGLVALACLAGCLSVHSKSKKNFFILMSPVLFTLLASAMHQYPFKGRLILFLAPFLLLFIGEGIKEIWEKMRRGSAAIGIIFIVLLFIYPVSWAAYHVKSPISHSRITSVLNYVRDNWREGDIIYVHYFAQYEFEYYSKYNTRPYNFDEDEYVIGIAPRGWYKRWKKQDVSKYYAAETMTQTRNDILNQYIRDLDKLKGRERVWLIISGQVSQGSIKEEDFFLYHLEAIGKRLDMMKVGGIAAYLYDLSGKEQTKDLNLKNDF